MNARHLCINVIRREVRRLAVIAAERRAVQAQSVRAAPSFRPLTEDEAEVVVGTELLAALAAGTGVIR